MKSNQYFSYLLRIWLTGLPGKPEWRASLEEPHTHQVTGFNSLSALFQHLLDLSEQAGKANPSQLPNPPEETQ
jgi:hypothetical protein